MGYTVWMKYVPPTCSPFLPLSLTKLPWKRGWYRGRSVERGLVGFWKLGYRNAGSEYSPVSSSKIKVSFSKVSCHHAGAILSIWEYTATRKASFFICIMHAKKATSAPGQKSYTQKALLRNNSFHQKCLNSTWYLSVIQGACEQWKEYYPF